MTTLIRLTADVLALFHLGFIVFAAFGGLLVLRWPRLAWLHLPAALWGAWVELAGWICPLTPLENHLRRAVGEAGYAGGFIDHYLWPLIYPAGLTREWQLALGIGVVTLNAALYGILLARRRHGTRTGGDRQARHGTDDGYRTCPREIIARQPDTRERNPRSGAADDPSTAARYR